MPRSFPKTIKAWGSPTILNEMVEAAERSYKPKPQRVRGYVRIARDWRERLAIFDAYCWTCWVCKSPIDPKLKDPQPWSGTLDHVKPLSQGGRDEVSNLKPAHKQCNEQRRMGRGLNRTPDPSGVFL